MLITVSRYQLASALAIAAECLTIDETTISVLLSASENRVLLSTIGAEIGASVQIRAACVAESGEAVFNAINVAALLKKKQDERLTIKSNGLLVTMTDGTGEHRFAAPAHGIVNQRVTFRSASYYRFSPAEFGMALKNTLIGAKGLEFPPSGILFEFYNDQIGLSAVGDSKITPVAPVGAAVARDDSGRSPFGRSVVIPIEKAKHLARSIYTQSACKVGIVAQNLYFETNLLSMFMRFTGGRPAAANERIALLKGDEQRQERSKSMGAMDATHLRFNTVERASDKPTPGRSFRNAG